MVLLRVFPNRRGRQGRVHVAPPSITSAISMALSTSTDRDWARAKPSSPTGRRLSPERSMVRTPGRATRRLYHKEHARVRVIRRRLRAGDTAAGHPPPQRQPVEQTHTPSHRRSGHTHQTPGPGQTPYAPGQRASTPRTREAPSPGAPAGPTPDPAPAARAPQPQTRRGPARRTRVHAPSAAR